MSDSSTVVGNYRLRMGAGADRGDAEALAVAMARESTLEVPAGVGPAWIEEELLGKVRAVEPVGTGDFRVVIDYSTRVLDGGLPQLLNVLFGNISLFGHVRLESVQLPDDVLSCLPGPRYGIPGIRRQTNREDGQPLVAAAIKPLGLSVPELAHLAGRFARAGVDVLKDDHGLADQPFAPFRERARAVARSVAEANAETGGATAYYTNVTGPIEGLAARAAYAREVGCGGILLCPGLVGLESMRALAASDIGLPIMAHPSAADTSSTRNGGIAPEALFGTLWRAAGADAVVYVNAGGRFDWTLDTCKRLNANLRSPLASMRASFAVPAGGIEVDDAGRWFREYGPETLLLIGGSLLAQTDLEGMTRDLVQAARQHREESP